MKSIFQFILSHSIFIAFCASALSFQTLQLLSLPMDNFLLAFIFFAALGAYNAYWILSSYSFNTHLSLVSFFHKRKSSFMVLLSATAGLVYCFTRLHLVMYNLIIAALLLVIYALPLMPFKQPLLLRKAGIFKTILLAFAWTIITTLVPQQISILAMGKTASLIFINRWLFMLMLCIIFDKRDAVIDKMRGLQSLATVTKPIVLHYLFALVFLGYIGVTLGMYTCQVTVPQVIALSVAGVVSLFVYIGSLKKRGYLFYYFLVDGLMFLSALLTGVAGVVNGG